MIARSFKSVAWVAAIGAAALICYMFSMKVAEERAGLAELDAQIGRMEQSIRTLKTELGTRGRVHQLQHWAGADFGFAAPKAGQFLEDEVTLARFEAPAEASVLEAPVRMASAAPAATQMPQVVQAAAPAPTPERPVVRRASAETEERPLVRQAALARVETPAPATRRAAEVRPAERPVRAAATAAAKPKPRATALVSDRTLRDLGTRSSAERRAN